jgi:hypothetical protein
VDIEAIQRSAYRRFYFDPGRVARILQRFPWNMHILKGFFYGFQASFSQVERLNRLWSNLITRWDPAPR